MFKKILFLAIFVLILTKLSFADVWVVYKEGQIYSLSEANDAVVPAGYSVKVLKGSIDDLGLTRPTEEYTFDGSKFKLNTIVIKAKEDAQLEYEKELAEKKEAKQSAIKKLKDAAGLNDDEVSALITSN